eukprot:gnl/TRDRNA2_/TRDRNA2_173323_c6_seq1.p1 gnl/TRDRNA2_/TRDRNA2_173323_c6~~gnl/TRDRNA2_/TRDRNA2_173323_c6_seq1.p1  ORF type:complete len:157 (-),score=31.42 gnl/TRDRNA2_/TRDRNA2_173323_c6_seq1:145-615(-)
MGFCDGESVGSKAVRRLGQRGGVPCERDQCAGPRQHHMGFCDGNPLDQRLFAALAREVEWRMSEFSAQNISNTAWAFVVTAAWSDTMLFAILAGAAELRLQEFSAQILTNTALSFAMAAKFDDKLFGGLAAATHRLVMEFNPQDLANAAAAFSLAG